MTKSQELRERYKVLKEKADSEYTELRNHRKAREIPTAEIVFDEILKTFDERLKEGNILPIKLYLHYNGDYVKVNGKKVKVLNRDIKRENLVFSNIEGFTDALKEVVRKNGDFNIRTISKRTLYISFRD